MFHSILNMFLPHFGRLITRIFHILINFIRTTAIFPFCKSERAFHLIIFRVKSIIKIIWKCYKVGGFIVYEWTLFAPSSNMTFPEGCGRCHKKVKSWQKQSFSCISKNIVKKMKLRTKYISMSIDSRDTGIWYLSSLINAKSYVERYQYSGVSTHSPNNAIKHFRIVNSLDFFVLRAPFLFLSLEDVASVLFRRYIMFYSLPSKKNNVMVLLGCFGHW